MDFSDIKFEFYRKRNKRKDYYCDNIMTVDLECSSGFVKDFEVEPYTGKDSEYYSECEKVSLCYKWQFSIDDHVYHGRTLESLRDFMEDLDDQIPQLKIVYVHNLEYEFQFFRNVFDFDEVFARDPRRPIYAKWGSYTFRCSYVLTNMSLDSWGKQKNLPVKKLVGDLDYTKLRTPLTPLTDQEIAYCENDCLVMYHGLKQYKEKYKHIADIPLTQTGEVRKECIKLMENEWKYRQQCIWLIPQTLDEFRDLVKIFVGGYCHANYLYTGKILELVDSFDISSSYPYTMLFYKFPMTRFKNVKYNEKYKHNDHYSYIIQFKCQNVDNKYYNSFLSKSKCDFIQGAVLDNGRVISCTHLVCTMSNVDFELFEDLYTFTDFEVLKFKISTNRYLNNTFRRYILKLYKNKTELKGIEGKEELYAISKQFINSLYGMCVTRDITDDIVFENGDWGIEYLDQEKFEKKIDILAKRNRKCFTAFQFGPWITAYARSRLWSAIKELDQYVAYDDTDSVKFIHTDTDYFEKENARVKELYKKVAKDLGVDESAFHPKDKHGIEHPIGIFDYEGTYDKFVTLGAKKYCDEKDGKLEMTVSGVRKSAVSQLKSIEEFKPDFEFDEDHAKKLIRFYNDDQPPLIWDDGETEPYLSNYKYGICMQPTTYKLGVTLEYYLLTFGNTRRETEILKNG